MDDLTRHFIATSKSLRYLMHYKEQEPPAKAQEDDSQEEIEKPCTNSAWGKKHPKMNESNSSADGSKDAIGDYFEQA